MHGSRADNLKDDLFELQDIEKRAKKIADKIKPFSFEIFEKKYLNYSETDTFNRRIHGLHKRVKAGGPNRRCHRLRDRKGKPD
jgi:hypothetical protein